MIIDFHSHIMPGFDDGAKDVDIAMQMIRKSYEQGVRKIVSTSHCYPYSGSDIDKFMEGRARAYDTLMERIDSEGVEVPDITLGCEVHLTCDLTKLRGIERLCIEDTDYMLVEMPSSKWSDSTLDKLYKLSLSGVKPIIAHNERNMSQDSELLSNLYTLDVLFQINAESFGMPVFKKFITDIMKNKLVHVVGSDMHNMKSRMPNMDKAKKNITKRYGEECWEYLMRNSQKILFNEDIPYKKMRSFQPQNILKRTIFSK